MTNRLRVALLHNYRDDQQPSMRLYADRLGDALRDLPVSVVHGGHFPSFGPTRYRQLIDEYLALKRKPGCHL